LNRSVRVSTQPLPQQVVDPVQTLPQPPQLAGSKWEMQTSVVPSSPVQQLWVSMLQHAPPQGTSPSFAQTISQTPEASQRPLRQSASSRQVRPPAHGAQTGPPQSTSVSSPFWTPSPHDLGRQPRIGSQTAPGAQSGSQVPVPSQISQAGSQVETHVPAPSQTSQPFAEQDGTH
jgi:hypothetical protein